MRRSAQLGEKESNSGNGAQRVFRVKKRQSDDRTSNIVTMDNGTMVEAFKYLNYCQLAKKSLVSKRFRNLIQTHRHSLALLYVYEISMFSYPIAPAAIKIFDKKLSAEAYNEWLIRNSYSKQVPLQDQVGSMQSLQNISHRYQLSAYAYYKDQFVLPSNDPVTKELFQSFPVLDTNHRTRDDRTTVLHAQVEVNHENWPVFQHFVRLATDPFIYIDRMELTYQIDVLNLLSGAINSDRLQCKEFILSLNGNSQKSLTWAKKHVRCTQLCINGKADLNQNEAILDFVMTGVHCTSSIKISCGDLSTAMVEFVQKFLDLQNWDEYHSVQSIEGFHFVEDQDIQLMKKDYSKFIVKEEREENHRSTENVFEFTNNAIGKKLQLTARTFDTRNDYWYSGSPTFSLEINV